MESLELLLQCIAHDYALHEIKHASQLVRRIARSREVQEEMIALQAALMHELENRKVADAPPS